MQRMTTKTDGNDLLPEELALGKALRFLRLQTGWKQHQAASSAKVTKAMLSGYETGRNLPTLPTLLNILKGLGANLCDLQGALNALQGGPQEVSARTRIVKPVESVSSREEREREIGKTVLEIVAYLQRLRTASGEEAEP